jgi:hypothetical protein
MSSKKKQNKQNNQTNSPIKTEDIPVGVEEYKPSDNIDKYPELQKPLYSYKILVYKNDWVRLQEEVTKYLNNGWQLAGGLCTTMSVSPYESVTVFSQAVYNTNG